MDARRQIYLIVNSTVLSTKFYFVGRPSLCSHICSTTTTKPSTGILATLLYVYSSSHSRGLVPTAIAIGEIIIKQPDVFVEGQNSDTRNAASRDWVSIERGELLILMPNWFFAASRIGIFRAEPGIQMDPAISTSSQQYLRLMPIIGILK
jgi:hypothetical protein